MNDKQDLLKSLVALNDSLDDDQIKLINDFLTEYSVHLTDTDLSYVAKIVTQLNEFIYGARQTYNEAKRRRSS